MQVHKNVCLTLSSEVLAQLDAWRGRVSLAGAISGLVSEAMLNPEIWEIADTVNSPDNPQLQLKCRPYVRFNPKTLIIALPDGVSQEELRGWLRMRASRSMVDSSSR